MNILNLLKRQFTHRVACRISMSITADYEIQGFDEKIWEKVPTSILSRQGQKVSWLTNTKATDRFGKG